MPVAITHHQVAALVEYEITVVSPVVVGSKGIGYELGVVKVGPVDVSVRQLYSSDV